MSLSSAPSAPSASTLPYQPLVGSSSQHSPVRGLAYHWRSWGQAQPGQAPLFLLHGWMDVGASW